MPQPQGESASSAPQRSWHDSELLFYLRAFHTDWITIMVGGASLVTPFANILLAKVWHPLPEEVLLGVSIMCVIAASFRVWQYEHHRRKAQPFDDLMDRIQEMIGDLEACAGALRIATETVEYFRPDQASHESNTKRSEALRLAVLFRHHYLDYLKKLEELGQPTKTEEGQFLPDLERDLNADSVRFGQIRLHILGHRLKEAIELEKAKRIALEGK